MARRKRRVHLMIRDGRQVDVLSQLEGSGAQDSRWHLGSYSWAGSDGSRSWQTPAWIETVPWGLSAGGALGVDWWRAASPCG